MNPLYLLALVPLLLVPMEVKAVTPTQHICIQSTVFNATMVIHKQQYGKYVDIDMNTINAIEACLK
jgi:hypothetical protein